jgi:hypothetical protein
VDARRALPFEAQPGPPLEFDLGGSPELEPLEPPCVRLGWPCHVNEIPEQTRLEISAVNELVSQGFEAGDTTDEIVARVAQRAGVEDVWSSEHAIVFKLVDSPPLPYLFNSSGRVVTVDPGGVLGSLPDRSSDVDEVTRSSRLVPFKTSTYARNAILGDPGAYDIPHGATPILADLFERAPMFESGVIEVHKNTMKPDGFTTSSELDTILAGFDNWRNMPYVDISAHGVLVGEAAGAFSGYSLNTAFENNTECLEWLDTQTRAQGVHCANSKTSDSPSLFVSLDALYSRNSAPLEKTIVYSGACYIGAGVDFFTNVAGRELLEGSAALLGWTDVVPLHNSDAASVEFAQWTVTHGLTTGDAFDKMDVRSGVATDDETGEDVIADIELLGAEDVRAREIVHFASRAGTVIKPTDTELLVFKKDDAKGWTAELAVRIDGVMPGQTGAFGTVLKASGRGALSATFEPDTLTPASPGSQPLDEFEHRWVVPVTISTGQKRPTTGSRFLLEATTTLPEGGLSSSGGIIPSVGAMSSGVSQGAGNYVATSKDCAFGHIQAGGGPGKGDFNLNKVATYASPVAGTFTISASLAERIGQDTSDEYVQETAPSFVITVTGDLPAEGDTVTYPNSQIALVANTSKTNGFATYMTEGDSGQRRGEVTLRLTRLGNGTYEGKLGGSAVYPDPGAEDDFSPSSMNIVFLAAPLGDDDETFQCF